MVRREGKGPPSSDLLVCFPTRAHLTLMPKPVSSPRRNLNRHYHNHLRKSMRGGSIGSSHTSPYLLTGSKHMGSDNLSEPSSPKVSCAGQIQVRSSTRSCKNWQTVMDEIEKLHKDRKQRPTWVETLGFKKEAMHFLSCLRRIKFDFHCLGTFSHVDITSDDEDEDEDKNDKETKQEQDQDQEQDLLDHDHDYEKEISSQGVFSKWFIALQENQECGVFEKDEKHLKSKEIEDYPSLPPTNALLLMRCRSAPAKSWMEEKEEEEREEQEQQQEDDHDYDHSKEEEHVDKDEKMENKETKRKSLMELMKNENDFYKLSIDIAKETWVFGGIDKDPFSRSKSWKR